MDTQLKKTKQNKSLPTLEAAKMRSSTRRKVQNQQQEVKTDKISYKQTVEGL